MASATRTEESTEGDGTIQTALSYLRARPRLQKSLIVGPPFGVLVLFFALPLLSMLLISFRQGNIDGPLTIQNYQQFITSQTYLTVVWRSLLISIKVTAIVTVVGYTLAYSIVRFTRYTTLLLLLVILPFWTSYIIRMYAWINILQSGGVLDSTLLLLNVVDKPIGLLYSQEAVLIGFTYVWLPLAVLPFYASLTNMDPALIDAAKDLGAGPLKAFFTVTLPTTINGVVTGVLLVFIPTFGSFITPRLLGGTSNVMIGMVIEEQFKSAFNWPFGAAIGMIVSLLVVALLIIGSRAGGNLLAQGGDSQ
ncbi:ABC transporter permease [Haladaptatus sp. W1]|uniref:ABC transporter permease n=1 Tax=Haladaptatus sp. W1 TaxID=1897478 RepID=UPI0008496F9B|nr:ABC transporter permease [Haladaptatus sp. W1]ODR81271.1 ABC transporter permease [Haladaptatus sp. W1]